MEKKTGGGQGCNTIGGGGGGGEGGEEGETDKSQKRPLSVEL